MLTFVNLTKPYITHEIERPDNSLTMKRFIFMVTLVVMCATGTPAKGDPLPKDRPACLLQRWPNSDGSETIIRCTFLPAIFAENEPPD